MLRRFSDNPTKPTRALQIWLILIGKAHSRQLMTYTELAELIGYKAPRPTSQVLDPIARYCRKHDLPPLTCIVVNQDTGRPGSGFIGSSSYLGDCEAVFEFLWYDLFPPTPEEFREAMRSGEKAV